MKEATDENREVTADRAEISAELEDVELCARLQDPSDGLWTARSKDTVLGGLFTVAAPSYWCIGSIYAPKIS